MALTIPTGRLARFLAVSALSAASLGAGLGAGLAVSAGGAATTATTCTAPVYSGATGEATYNVDPGSHEYWWVSNDEWSGDGQPQHLYVCNQSSWYVEANQKTNGGAVETYPDTEYDVGGRASAAPNQTVGSTVPLSGWASMNSTFSEVAPTTGNWDFGYDLWLTNWSAETMIWNQWHGGQSYWPSQAVATATLTGTLYTFTPNGTNCNTTNVGHCELIFARESQVSSGSVNILAAFQWEVAHGYAKATQIPTQLEYGVEIAGTSGTEKFSVNGLTMSLATTAGVSQPTGTAPPATTPPATTTTTVPPPTTTTVPPSTTTTTTVPPPPTTTTTKPPAVTLSYSCTGHDKVGTPTLTLHCTVKG